MAQAGETDGVLTAAADMLQQANQPDFEGSFRLPPKPQVGTDAASTNAATLVAAAAPDSPTSMQTDLSSVAQQREADDAAAQVRWDDLWPLAMRPFHARHGCPTQEAEAARLEEEAKKAAAPPPSPFPDDLRFTIVIESIPKCAECRAPPPLAVVCPRPHVTSVNIELVAGKTCRRLRSTSMRCQAARDHLNRSASLRMKARRVLWTAPWKTWQAPLA